MNDCSQQSFGLRYFDSDAKTQESYCSVFDSGIAFSKVSLLPCSSCSPPVRLRSVLVRNPRPCSIWDSSPLGYRGHGDVFSTAEKYVQGLHQLDHWQEFILGPTVPINPINPINPKRSMLQAEPKPQATQEGSQRPSKDKDADQALQRIILSNSLLSPNPRNLSPQPGSNPKP